MTKSNLPTGAEGITPTLSSNTNGNVKAKLGPKLAIKTTGILLPEAEKAVAGKKSRKRKMEVESKKVNKTSDTLLPKVMAILVVMINQLLVMI